MWLQVGCFWLTLAVVYSFSEQVQLNSVSHEKDCSDVKSKNPEASSGVYTIQPKGTAFQVYCEMRADGGWTVFQRRSGADVKFDRKWRFYKNGFGNVTNDHWLGLQKIFALTKSRKWTLRVDLWDHEGNTAYAEYSNFKLGNSKSGFKLQVKKYKGTAGDAFRGNRKRMDQNGFGFSTIDRDNDGCKPCIFGDIAENKCAFKEGGGWWFSRCGLANLHGEYHPAGHHIGWSSGLHWETWKTSFPYSLKETRMMIKPME